MKKLIANKIQCAYCGKIIESKHRHDFKFCMCGSIFIDGGLDYIRCGGILDDIIPLHEYKEVNEDE